MQIPEGLVWAPKPKVDATTAGASFEALAAEIHAVLRDIENRRNAGAGSLWGEIEDVLNRLNRSAYELADSTFRDAEVAKWIVQQRSHIRDAEHYLAYLHTIGQRVELAAAKLRPVTSSDVTESQRVSVPPVERFKIMESLGAGGMANVYRAYDTELRREVAVKFPKVEVLSAASGKERFRREVEAAARLEHSNIARLYDAELDGSQPFLVQELVPGEDLRVILARDPLPEEMCLALARQLLAALEHAHRAGVIHRDVKPANIRISPDQRLKLLDFGLGKWVAIAEGESTQIDLTKQSAVVGTPGYIAPEVMFGESPSTASDMYAFGVTLCEMLTAKKPNPSEIVSGKPALPGSSPLRVLVNACCDRDASKRPSAAEAIRRLDALLPGESNGRAYVTEANRTTSVDDLFNIAHAEGAARRSEGEERRIASETYERQVVPLVEACIEAVRQKALEMNEHPRNPYKAAIMAAGTQITIRRPSTVKIPDRRIEVRFRRDLGLVSWIYEVSPNPVYADYETVDSGQYAFHVAGEKLMLNGLDSPFEFADVVLGEYIRDCARDSAEFY